MPATKRLTKDDVKPAIAKGGMVIDGKLKTKISAGNNLYLFIKGGRGYFIHQFRDGDKIRKHSLGPADKLTLAAAHREREKFMVAKRAGAPLAIRTRGATGETFGVALATYLVNHPEVPGSTQSLAAKYIKADFRAKAMTAITAEDVAGVLKGDDEDGKPLWTGPGPNRGNRFRLLMEHVFAAKAINPNPATWQGGALPHQFSKDEQQRAATVNQKSMPWQDVPAFLKTKGDTIEDRAGLFTTLSASRRKEALAAKWSEFDFANRVWTVPGERMKKKRVHKVPLTDAMIAALGTPGAPDEYVFQNEAGGPLSNSHAALDKEWFLPVDPKDGKPFTLHGMRTSFSTWAQEQDDGRAFAEKVILTAIAHKTQDNEADAAYLRSDHFAARRKLMEEWSKFVTGL
jgi:integrase